MLPLLKGQFARMGAARRAAAGSPCETATVPLPSGPSDFSSRVNWANHSLLHAGHFPECSVRTVSFYLHNNPVYFAGEETEAQRCQVAQRKWVGEAGQELGTFPQGLL